MAFLICLMAFLRRQNARKGKEAGLQHGVRAPTHAARLRHRRGIDHIKAELFLDQLLLPLARQLLPGVLRAIGRIEQDRRAGRRVTEDVGVADEMKLAAGHKAGLADQVGCTHRPRTEPQVRKSSSSPISSSRRRNNPAS